MGSLIETFNLPAVTKDIFVDTDDNHNTIVKMFTNGCDRQVVFTIKNKHQVPMAASISVAVMEGPSLSVPMQSWDLPSVTPSNFSIVDRTLLTQLAHVMPLTGISIDVAFIY